MITDRQQEYLEFLYGEFDKMDAKSLVTIGSIEDTYTLTREEASELIEELIDITGEEIFNEI